MSETIDEGYSNPAALVSTEWLAHRLGGEVKVIEVDEDTEAYQWGHIPGAVMLNWMTEMQDPVRRDLVDREGFERLIGSRGITETDEVVLYGGNNNWFATYAYWLFRLYGHRDVRLMNGGRKKWELEDRPLVTDGAAVVPCTYHAAEPDATIRARRDEVLAAVGAMPLVDVRSADEFSGRLAAPPHLPHEQAQKKGHIPGARNVPWSTASREDGSFKSVAELRAIYQEGQGLRPGEPVITYCRIGERSSHTWFVLRELLGFQQVKNYDGSWTEYGSMVGVPIERTSWED